MTNTDAKPARAHSKHTTTEYNRHKRVHARIADIYARADAFKLSHDRILDLLSELYASHDYRRLTSYYRGMAVGQREALASALWQKLEWRIGPVDGPVSDDIHKAWLEPLPTLCRVPGALYGAHYYAGTDKTFNLYKPIN